MRSVRAALCGLVVLAVLEAAAARTAPAPATPIADPIPPRSQGMGPYPPTVLRNVTIVNGTGAAAQGPFDLVLSGDRITEIRAIGAQHAIDAKLRAEPGDFELDLTGYYVLPGFVDSHVHLHSLADEQKVPADYVLKLWVPSGITSVREVGSERAHRMARRYQAAQRQERGRRTANRRIPILPRRPRRAR